MLEEIAEAVIGARGGELLTTVVKLMIVRKDKRYLNYQIEM